MATFTNALSVPYRVVGAEKETVTDVALDSSYPVAGEAVTAANLGLGTVNSAVAVLKTSATTTVNLANFHYDEANAKLLAFDETPAAVADLANLDGAVVRVTARGTGSPS